jgi:hypothetical protein
LPSSDNAEESIVYKTFFKQTLQVSDGKNRFNSEKETTVVG